MKTAIYPGSFNPWTKGHQDILDRALTIFDKVIIVLAANPDKKISLRDMAETLKPVIQTYGGRVTLQHTFGLVSQFGFPIVRGVRQGDWEYEQNLAVWNKELGVETVFLCPSPENSHINSSALRTLHKEGVSILKYAGNLDSIKIWKKNNKE